MIQKVHISLDLSNDDLIILKKFNESSIFEQEEFLNHVIDELKLTNTWREAWYILYSKLEKLILMGMIRKIERYNANYTHCSVHLCITVIGKQILQQMNKISFNQEKYNKLVIRYAQALKNNEESFVFENIELLTSYAKYLIDYLTPQFKESHDNN